MAVDIEYLRQHYASLSDEALAAINRRDLVDAARTCYDEELRRRDISDAAAVSEDDEDAELEAGEFGEDWMEEAAVVYSNSVYSPSAPAPDAAGARDALEAEGIPCHLELVELKEEEPSSGPHPTHQWRVLVPGQLNMQATSILDRDLFNADFEAEWRAHLEAFSDEELKAMHPKIAFCGLFDRVERVTRAYNEELARRK
jgi:hypothetical protein